MARKPDTWMPLYVGDYLADTRHLRLAEHGAYLLLIMAYWRAQKPLPNDDERLARICGLSKSQWKPYRDALAPFFQITEEGWAHKRIDALIIEASENAQRNAQRAKRAAKTRWSKDATSNAPSMPRAMLDECPSPSPSSSSVANATSAVAPSEELDLKARIFGPALEWLGKQTKKPEGKLRPLVGKWCSEHGDGRTLEALQQASRNAPLDPVPYIEKLLSGAPKPTAGHSVIDLDKLFKTETPVGH